MTWVFDISHKDIHIPLILYLSSSMITHFHVPSVLDTHAHVLLNLQESSCSCIIPWYSSTTFKQLSHSSKGTARNNSLNLYYNDHLQYRARLTPMSSRTFIWSSVSLIAEFRPLKYKPSVGHLLAWSILCPTIRN
jgi:hypothetical protein